MEKNKTGKPALSLGKYFKYAIGEIVLVVIGILIALQINNANEIRKQNETLNSIFTIVKDDLNSDLKEVYGFIENYEKVRKPIFDTLLYAKPTFEDLNKNPNYSMVFRGYEDIEVNTRGFDLLKNQPTAAQINSKLTTKISEFFNDHFIEIELAQLELSKEFQDNNLKWKTYDWNADLLIDGKTEAYYKFILNDPEARKRMATYYLFYNIYVDELRRFREGAETLIQEIEIFNNKK